MRGSPLTLAGVVSRFRARLQEKSMSPTKVTDQSFETSVLRASEPVLVDFWAEWCGPCKMIAPFLEELAKDMDGKVTVAKINIDENPQTPMKYGVHGIPTLILFKNGQVAATKIGAMPKSKLVEWVNSVL
jgi:thioredoxin 1